MHVLKNITQRTLLELADNAMKIVLHAMGHIKRTVFYVPIRNIVWETHALQPALKTISPMQSIFNVKVVRMGA